MALRSHFCSSEEKGVYMTYSSLLRIICGLFISVSLTACGGSKKGTATVKRDAKGTSAATGQAPKEGQPKPGAESVPTPKSADDKLAGENKDSNKDDDGSDESEPNEASVKTAPVKEAPSSSNVVIQPAAKRYLPTMQSASGAQPVMVAAPKAVATAASAPSVSSTPSAGSSSNPAAVSAVVSKGLPAIQEIKSSTPWSDLRKAGTPAAVAVSAPSVRAQPAIVQPIVTSQPAQPKSNVPFTLATRNTKLVEQEPAVKSGSSSAVPVTPRASSTVQAKPVAPTKPVELAKSAEAAKPAPTSIAAQATTKPVAVAQTLKLVESQAQPKAVDAKAVETKVEVTNEARSEMIVRSVSDLDKDDTSKEGIGPAAYRDVVDKLLNAADFTNSEPAGIVNDSNYLNFDRYRIADTKEPAAFSYIPQKLADQVTKSNACDLDSSKGCILVETTKKGAVVASYIGTRIKVEKDNIAYLTIYRAPTVVPQGQLKSDLEMLNRIQGGKTVLFTSSQPQ